MTDQIREQRALAGALVAAPREHDRHLRHVADLDLAIEHLEGTKGIDPASGPAAAIHRTLATKRLTLVSSSGDLERRETAIPNSSRNGSRGCSPSVRRSSAASAKNSKYLA